MTDFDTRLTYADKVELNRIYGKLGAQKDPAAPHVAIQKLMTDQSELLAYMNPTPEQAKQAAENALKIARLSLDIFDYYKRYY